MPTIDQLPPAVTVNPTDELALDQAGVTGSVTVATLLAGVQPVVTIPTGSLLGRNSLGPGGPEPVTAGLGLSLHAGTLVATGADHAAYTQLTALATAGNAVLTTPAGPAQLPLGLLRGLFTAGSNIAISATGIISASISQGAQGPTGPAGNAGANGATWTAGVGAPLAANGNIGDFYLNTSGGAVFEKGSSGWSQIATLIGPQGPAGPAGAAGPTGPAGPPGTIWWTGAGAPAATTGNVGDLFFATASGVVYQKTASATWTQIANLTGPGSTGSITASHTTTSLNATDYVGLSQGGADARLLASSFGSLLPAAARIGTATTTTAALMDRFGDFPNVVRDFGAPLNGADAAPAINAAIAAASGRGGGTILIPNTGVPYMLASPIVPLSGVCITGVGNPLLQLQPGANCAVVESQNFTSLVGTSSNAGVIKSVIEGLTLDGNSVSQSPANPDLANGISFFGPGVKIRRVVIQNVAGHGVRLSWGSGNPASNGVVEGVVDDVFVHGAGRNGVWFVGSHDTSFRDIIVRNASLSSDSGYVGFLLSPGGSLRAFNLHAYNDPNLVQMAYAASVAGYAEFTDCHFEGSHQSVLILGPFAKFSNCMFYNPQSPVAGKALVDLQGSNAIFSGCGFDLPRPANASTPGTPMYAIAFGTATIPVSNIVIEGCTFTDFDVYGPFNFVNDGGNSIISAVGSTTNTAGATGFAGTIQPTTSIDYRQAGTRIATISAMVVGDATGATGNGTMIEGAAAGYPVGLQAVGKDSVVGLFLAPKGGGALMAAPPDSTSNGGNVRGTNAVDWQTQRSAATQVAHGYAAVITGGIQNTASGNYSVVLGGNANTADAGYTEAGGNASHTHGRQCTRVWSSGSFVVTGDCQKGIAGLLRAITTSATPVYATTDMAAPGGYNNLQLQTNSALCIRLRAIARDYYSGAAALFSAPDLLLTCGGTHAAILLTAGNSIAMTMTQSSGNTVGWGIAVSADPNTGGLLVAVTGQAGRTIHWQVDPEFLELI
jgi:hypothetical protein